MAPRYEEHREDDRVGDGDSGVVANQFLPHVGAVIPLSLHSAFSVLVHHKPLAVLLVVLPLTPVVVAIVRGRIVIDPQAMPLTFAPVPLVSILIGPRYHSIAIGLVIEPVSFVGMHRTTVDAFAPLLAILPVSHIVPTAVPFHQTSSVCPSLFVYLSKVSPPFARYFNHTTRHDCSVVLFAVSCLLFFCFLLSVVSCQLIL